MRNRVTFSKGMKELFQDGAEIYESPMLEEEQMMGGEEMMGEEQMMGEQPPMDDEMMEMVPEMIEILEGMGYQIIEPGQ